MLPTRFRFIWQSGFRGEDLKKSANQKQELPRIETKCAIFIEDLPRMLPTKFQFIWQSRFRGDNFLESNQSETIIVCGGHVCQQIGTK